MPAISLSVKVKAGRRTPVEVDVYYTAKTGEPTLTLINGETVTAGQLADWIATELNRALQVSEGTLERKAALKELTELWEKS